MSLVDDKFWLSAQKGKMQHIVDMFFCRKMLLFGLDEWYLFDEMNGK